MKYKFSLSYLSNNKFIPVDLSKIDFLREFKLNEINTLDEFTTYFESYDKMLSYLKDNKLIPDSVNRLYVTFESKKDKLIKQELYAFNKTLFFNDDKDYLKYSYVYRYFRDRIEDMIFMENIIEFYEKKYIYKKFDSLKNFVNLIKESGLSNLSPSSQSTYIEEITHFLDFIFYSKTKKGDKVNYKNVRDFLCYIKGEKPIKVKEIVKDYGNISINDYVSDYDFDTFTSSEFSKHNDVSSIKFESFKPYTDGNDFIAPVNPIEVEESLKEYAKKYCLKRDNGEYE